MIVKGEEDAQQRERKRDKENEIFKKCIYRWEKGEVCPRSSKEKI